MSNSSKVWSRFESKQKDVTIKLRIEDLPVERLEDALDFMEKYFFREEAFHIAAGIAENKEAINEYRELMRIIYRENPPRAVICCLDDNSPKPDIIGLSTVQLIESPNRIQDILEKCQFKTNEMRSLFNILLVLDELVKKNFERYFDGRGISVHPQYRGMGIANEFVKVRIQQCIELGVPISCAWMTAIGTQRAAEKNNWKTLYEVSPDELSKRSGLDFGNRVSMFKLMYIKTD